MPIEDFVGHWVAGNGSQVAATIEIAIVEGRLVVRAIDGIDGELAEMRDLVSEKDEVRFTAHWSSGRATGYRLLLSDGQMVVHFTVFDTAYFTRDLNDDGTHRWHSGILHVVPTSSAGGSLIQAIRTTGRTDHVISFRDDLSCGPIDSDDADARRRWWASMFDDRDIDLDRFWRRVMSTTDRLVVWFGRHSAQEYAFFLALADRLGERPYDIIDVTGLQLPRTRPGGSPELSRPKQAVSLIGEEELALLLGTEHTVTSQEREDAVLLWRRLKAENAPFRIVTNSGLTSAPADVFDELLLKRATKEWRKVARVIGETMGYAVEPYLQVGDMMLLTRVVSLIEQGKLLARGDPWLMRNCEVRLPD